MLKWIKYIFLGQLLMLFASPIVVNGQFFLYSETPIDIETSFLLHSLVAKSNTSFYNSLRIKNNSNRTEIFNLNITVPQDWKVIGSDKIEIKIDPLDSIIVPIRVSIGGRVRGDIGYSIIASITDSRGNTVKNEYCFVKIPRETDLTVRVLDRIKYFDPNTGSADFSISLNNSGNREEIVNLQFDGQRDLGIGSLKNSFFAQDITVKPYTDTIVTFTAHVTESIISDKNSFPLVFNAVSIDTTFKTNIWFRRLKTHYKNSISPKDKVLSVEFLSQGLMQGDRRPKSVGIVEGSLLMKGDSKLYYYYRNFNSRKFEDFFVYNRMYLGGTYGPWKLEIGDSYRSMISPMIGRGFSFAFKNDFIKNDFVVNRNLRSKTDNVGNTLIYSFSKDFSIKVGGAYNQQTINDFKSKMVVIGSSFRIGQRKHSFSGHFAYNNVNRLIDGKDSHNEFGYELRYNNRLNKVSNNLKINYGSDFFYGNYNGRFQLLGNSMYSINNKNRVIFSLNVNKSYNPRVQNSSILETSESFVLNSKAEYTYFLSPQVHVYGGPIFEQYSWSGVLAIPQNEVFTTNSYKANAGIRIIFPDLNLSVSPQYYFTKTNVAEFPIISQGSVSQKREWFNNQYFITSFRSKSFGFVANYSSGPKTVYEHYRYFYFNRTSRKIYLMPFFERFIYKDILKLYSSLSYTNDLISRSSYTNLNSRLTWFFPKDWTLNILSVFSLQNKTNPQDAVEVYQTFYLEVGIKKEFDIQHPRIKYYDVNLVFFKDYNGDGMQSENEPGIKNVFVQINYERNGQNNLNIPGDFYSSELLSDNLGRVRLEKIPEGLYSMIYNPIGKEAGTFSKAVDEMTFRVTKSGSIFFPFVEKNKVYGKIILNRSRLSGLGRLDLSNVRITATDSQGRSYSTLTNKEGEFILFAPVTDEYILNINNIFYENFDLRQNNFLVQFNGYKQFEVNYVFDEKIRRINFATTPEGEGSTSVQQVRRTNISGTVKDANSQRPVRAKVNLINTRTNAIVTSSNSSASSGEYTLTFMAGDNYLLEVLADDYWYLSENIVLQQVTTFMNITRDVTLKPISVGSKVELNIRFDVNSTFLAPESVAELNRLVRLLKQNPSVKLEVQGHCDDLEALQKPEIALERANAVVKYLIENGYSNLQVKSLGNTVPIASNDTEEGRMRNRRVDVEVVSK
jgi:outer membrane protein OmpA-like peptidoglycan-associated protein